ncbi:spermine oxidase [Episyrphus balteatus]|uniref:spermine oxidase n=1 Tax=Episyrphus balteatus TaxID=286459 RepID=UPI00248583BD|nr:spermine oxidase [Episyrphus balteatus]
MSKLTAKIVVIGAGASGIAAATKLLQSGFQNVIILEAEDRIGGRIYTIPFGENVVDLGAQWCHGEKANVIYEMVEHMNLLDTNGTIYDDYKSIRSNKEVLSDSVNDALKSIVFGTQESRFEELIGYEGSFGTYLTEKFYKELQRPEFDSIDRVVAKEFFENYKKNECSTEASDSLFEVSSPGHLEYWGCDGDLLLNWKDKGFVKFLQILMKSSESSELGILDGRVKLNRRVERIIWDPSGKAKILIKNWNGELIKADHVICTTSLGVLKENHSKMFSPQLPEPKLCAIEGLNLGTVDKFFLEFDQPFGPEDWSSFCLLWTEKDLEELRNSHRFWLENVFGFFKVPYQPIIIAGWIIGSNARHMETQPEDEVLEGIMWLLQKFLSFNVPMPKNFLRTQWYSNPNFRGSYTFRSMLTEELKTGANDLTEPLAAPNGMPILQFAGEATSPHYYSTVHGAVESGWREAQRLINYYSTKLSQL